MDNLAFLSSFFSLALFPPLASVKMLSFFKTLLGIHIFTFFFYPNLYITISNNDQCYNNLYFAESVSILICSVTLSTFLMRRMRVQIGLGRETFENVGRVFVNVWAVEYFCGMVGVLNSLETNKLVPHIHLMEVLQALDNTGAFQKSESSPSQITAQCACANGRQSRSEEMTLDWDPPSPPEPGAGSTTRTSFLVYEKGS